MRSSLRAAVLSLGAVVTLLGPLTVAPAAYGATAALPTNASITGIGVTTTVDLSLTGGAGTEAADIDVTYDAAVVSVSGDAVEGPLTAGCTLTTNAGTAGIVRIGVACVNAVTANGVFVRLTFQSLATGSSPLTISRCSLNEDAIACAVANGQLTVSLTGGPAALAAVYVSASVPTSMTAGQQYSVSVTMRNTGTTPWTAAALFRLGAINPYDNVTWGTNRVGLAGADSIGTNQQKTFTWTVTAPATAGTYNFQWRMLREGVAWFGALSANTVVTVNPPSAMPNAAFVWYSLPSTINAGHQYSVSLTMRNTGGTTWTPGGFYRLGAISPYDNTMWGSNRAGLASGESIAPGQQKTFTWTITAPVAGNYYFQWRMVQDGVMWFGDPSPATVLNVSFIPGPPDAGFVSRSVPTTMTAGQQYGVSVTMRNSGGTTWSPGALYRLGAINPHDNVIWGMNRVDLAAGDSVAPGQVRTFSWTVRAPTTPGQYNFQWRTVQDGVTWFGDSSANAVVTVVP